MSGQMPRKMAGGATQCEMSREETHFVMRLSRHIRRVLQAQQKPSSSSSVLYLLHGISHTARSGGVFYT